MTVVLQETQRAIFYAPFYAAFALDAYGQEDVAVDFRSSAQPEDAANALFTGAADVSWGGPMRVMLARDRDPRSDLLCFCEVVTRDPFLLIGRAPRPDFVLADLTGLCIGAVAEVPTPWMCLQHDIRGVGLDPASLSINRKRPMAENVVALRHGRIDVAQLFEPFVTELIRSGEGHIWYAAAKRGNTAYTCLYARRVVLNARRQEFLKMVRAINRTLKWVASAVAEDIACAIAGYFPTVSHEVLTEAIGRYKELGIWGHDPWLPEAGYDQLKASIVSGGLVESGWPYEQAVDNSLAAIVVEEEPAPLEFHRSVPR